MKRILSGIQPTSEPTLGNYLGAMRRWPDHQHDAESFYFLPDLHALTVEQQGRSLRDRTIDMANTLLAVGIDPEVSTIFAQSHVRAHTELAWLMSCTASFGELRRMTQFKEKAGDNENVTVGLFSYPCLMAADILLYDADEVPVGHDQRQHVELTRDLAIRFNGRHGDTFKVPKATLPSAAARVRDLQNPLRKMSKSIGGAGTIWLYEDPSSIEKKIKRAVTDNETEVRYDWDQKPGVSNLLELLASCTGEDPSELAKQYHQYGALKGATAAAIIETVAPVQQRYEEFSADPATARGILAAGAALASEIADTTLARAKRNAGLLMPS